jgi:hypothetical protein
VPIAPEIVMTPDVSAIERYFWPHGSNRDLWMIVDGARDRSILPYLQNSHFTFACLYSGTLPYQLEAAAPQLVQLEYDDKYTRALIQKSWGKSWGVFLKSEASMERLRKHLRRFLIVQSWKGQRLLFRYYDPRVLRVYLPTCVHVELDTVYGSAVKCFWTENEAPSALLQFDFTDGRLIQREFDPQSGEIRKVSAAGR